jgi:hypothetical protein
VILGSKFEINEMVIEILAKGFAVDVHSIMKLVNMVFNFLGEKLGEWWKGCVAF